jgi:hypothetical protein
MRRPYSGAEWFSPNKDIGPSAVACLWTEAIRETFLDNINVNEIRKLG